MINLLNSIKALIVCAVTTGIYTLYTSTSGYQEQLTKEGLEVSKIEALMHYSTLIDALSRMLPDWARLFLICFISCFLLMLWLKSADNSL